MSETAKDTAQNAPPAHLEAIPAILGPRKPRRSVKPQAVKTAVILKTANGISKSQIARDLGITRPTVNAILEESDLDRQLQSGVILSSTLIPKALEAVEKTLDKGDGILGLNFLKWQLGENPNSKSGQKNALEAVFSNCQVLIQQATSTIKAGDLHNNAAEPSTNAPAQITQPADSTQVKP